MPDENPPTPGDGVLEIEADVSPGEEGTRNMDPAVVGIMVQQLTQSGIIAQNNFITVTKAQDYDYLEGKRIISLDEAVGVREVQSQVNPGGPAPRP